MTLNILQNWCSLEETFGNTGVADREMGGCWNCNIIILISYVDYSIQDGEVERSTESLIVLPDDL